MKVFIIALAVALSFGCSTVGQSIIPDYKANNQILKEFPSEVVISFAPGYPQVCANMKNADDKWYRTVTLFVHLRNQDPAKVSVLINSKIESLMEAGVGLGHQFRYPAGVGRHEIQIWIKSDPPQYFVRSLTVSRCGPVKKSRIEPAVI